MDTAKTLGHFLKEKRSAAGLTLRELAEKIGVTAPFLSDIELGRRYPSDGTLADLAKTLRVPINELKRYDGREPVAEVRKLVDQVLHSVLHFARC